jgi:hypothetical protein
MRLRTALSARKTSLWLAVASQLAFCDSALAQFTHPPLSPALQTVTGLRPPKPLDNRQPPPLPADAPMPSADPRDFSGTWMHIDDLIFRNVRDMYALYPPFNDAGAKVLARRVKSKSPYINASAVCRPPGQFWQLDLNFPFHIFQSKLGMEWVFEEFHGAWNVVLDPRAVPAPKKKAYMGRSEGHWEGDTLVVETKDFAHDFWLDADGTPFSASGKLTYRIRKVNTGDHNPYLQALITIDDPTYYTRPWTLARRYHWRPNRVVMKEYNCEEQIGDPTVDADAGLIPEPKD